jgi:uncharacterized protein (TIGR04255 family)
LAEISLPSFNNPPVTEVVAAMKFKQLPGLNSIQLVRLWERFRDDFPNVEEKPPYEAPIERFDLSAGTGFNFSLSVMDIPPTPRLWFIDEEGLEVIQVQRDWFACNWRKVRPNAEYARWHSRRETFLRHYRSLESFVADEGLGPLVPEQCEVTYINHIVPAAGWESHGDLPQVVRLVHDYTKETEGENQHFLSPAESYQLKAQYIIHNEAGERIGRLYVSAQPAYKIEDNQPIFVLDLTARGRPEGEGVSGVVRFLDRAHLWIVKAFTEITTEPMQKAWGRYE